MADVHTKFCESLQEWTTYCTCDDGQPCGLLYAQDVHEDRAEHEARDER